jgi:hypothetical protein
MMTRANLYSIDTNHTIMVIMSKVTLKVEDATHKKLLEVVSKMQIKRGKRVTMDEAIKELIVHAKS